jgi:fumarate hydratase class II
MDATPLTVGQELSGYVAQLNYGLKAVKHLSALIRSSLRCCNEAGLNTPAGYDVTVAKYIAEFTGHPF